MKPIVYETSPNFLDIFSPPTAGHGRDRDDKYYHRLDDRREQMLFLFHIHFSCYIFPFSFLRMEKCIDSDLNFKYHG